MKILVTGAAGFIASKIAAILAKRGDEVIGVDNINDYYDVRLKYARLRELLGIEYDGTDMPFAKEYASTQFPNFRFIRLTIEDKSAIDALFEKEHFDVVLNLAAQAGVRYSITICMRICRVTLSVSSISSKHAGTITCLNSCLLLRPACMV